MGHELDTAIIWHGRLMVLAWAVLLPAGVIIARYFKILPRQNWPGKLDSRVWWHGHLFFQYAGALVTVAALYLIYSRVNTGGQLPWLSVPGIHKILGWSTIVLLVVQVGFGVLRGSKGGPTEIERTGTERGDHYDMTLRRRVFERVHKTVGYLVLVLAQLAILFGLTAANAPMWMPVTMVVWWLFLIVCYFHLQSRQLQMGSFEAIWGMSKTKGPIPREFDNHPWRDSNKIKG